MKRSRIFSAGSGILIIHMLVLAVVVSSGILAYRHLDRIVVGIGQEARPDYRLVTMKEILNNLSHAANTVKSYNLTENDAYLTDFYNAVSNTEDKLESLRGKTAADTLSRMAVDSLQQLVEQKFMILDELLKVRDEYRVKEALNKVIEKINEAPAEPKVDTVVTEPEETKKRGFFARIFGGKKKQQPPDTTIVVQQPQQSAINEISEDVQAIKDRETALEKQMNTRELALVKQDNLVMEKIRQLLDVMEARQLEQLNDKSRHTELLISRVQNLIGIFVLSAAALLFLAVLAILNYVRKNNQYQKVLKDARRQAEELAREKERFLANMSHEIRTPLNAITGFTEQLLNDRPAEKQAEQLTIIKKAGDHLVNIINEVLDFSRLKAGKLELRKHAFRPVEVFDEVARLMQPMAENKGLRLVTQNSVSDNPVLTGDAVRLRQIMLNLVSNAIKYTNIGEVRMSMAISNTNDGHEQLSLYVSDTGIGMQQTFLEKIFGEFEQAEPSPANDATGTGLGLAITKKLIDLHGGSIVINSTPGQGTSVSVSIPYRKGNTSELQQDKQKTGALVDISGMQVLVADDEAYNRKLIGAILKKHGAEPVEAKDGKAALQLFDEKHFDLVLMDVRMPNMNGLEAAGKMKKKNPGVPIIALTAAVTEYDAEKYRRAGMDLVLAKPFPEAKFFDALAKIFPGKAMEQARKAPSPDRPDAGPVADFDELRRLSNGDMKFFSEMLDTYIETARTNMAAMQKALDHGDLTNVGEAAHRMRSSTKHIGAGVLVDLLRKIEGATLHDQPVTILRNWLYRLKNNSTGSSFIF